MTRAQCDGRIRESHPNLSRTIENQSRTRRRVRRAAISFTGLSAAVALLVGCDGSTTSNVAPPSSATQAYSTPERPTSFEELNTDICSVVNIDRVESLHNLPAGTLDEDNCDNLNMHEPAPAGAVMPVSSALWVAPGVSAAVSVYAESFVAASMRDAAKNDYPVTVSAFSVNGHQGQWYDTLHTAEIIVNVHGNTLYVDVSGGHNPEATQTFAVGVVDDFVDANS